MPMTQQDILDHYENEWKSKDSAAEDVRSLKYSHPVEDAVLYPIYATTFIWAALIALAAYGTPIRFVNIAGMALLIVGMYLMGRT